MQWDIKLQFRLPSFHYYKTVKVNRHRHRQMDRQAHQNEAECFHSTRLYCVQNQDRWDNPLPKSFVNSGLLFLLYSI